MQILGHLSDAHLIELFEYIFHKKPGRLLTFLAKVGLSNFNPEFIWKRTQDLLRALLWIKHGAPSEQFPQSQEKLSVLAGKVSVDQIHRVLDLMYAKEPVFAKTANRHNFLEILFLQLCQYVGTQSDNSGMASAQQQRPALINEQDKNADDQEDEEQEETV